MFKKGETIIYPIYGAGKITEKYDEELSNEVVKYYQISFETSQVTVSVPVEKAEEFGVREPLSQKDIKSNLKNLSKRAKLDKDTITNLSEIATEMMKSGKFEDAIDLLNLYKAVIKHHNKEGKNLSFSHTKNVENIVKFVQSEISAIKKKKAVSKFKVSPLEE